MWKFYPRVKCMYILISKVLTTTLSEDCLRYMTGTSEEWKLVIRFVRLSLLFLRASSSK